MQLWTNKSPLDIQLWTNKILEASGVKLNSALENVYDKQKLQTRKAIIGSSYSGQPGGDQSEQQQQQSANHSSYNAEI